MTDNIQSEFNSMVAYLQTLRELFNEVHKSMLNEKYITSISILLQIAIELEPRIKKKEDLELFNKNKEACEFFITNKHPDIWKARIVAFEMFRFLNKIAHDTGLIVVDKNDASNVFV